MTLSCYTILIKMFRGNIQSAVKPADRPAVKIKTSENVFVAQRGKELIFLNEGQTVENALTAVIESQMQPIVVEETGSCDPFQFVCLFHKLIQWIYFYQSLAILHAGPIHHQFFFVKVEPFKDEMQGTAWHLSRYFTRLYVDGSAILVIAHWK